MRSPSTPKPTDIYGTITWSRTFSEFGKPVERSTITRIMSVFLLIALPTWVPDANIRSFFTPAWKHACFSLWRARNICFVKWLSCFGRRHISSSTRKLSLCWAQNSLLWPTAAPIFHWVRLDWSHRRCTKHSELQSIIAGYKLNDVSIWPTHEFLSECSLTQCSLRELYLA